MKPVTQYVRENGVTRPITVVSKRGQAKEGKPPKGFVPPAADPASPPPAEPEASPAAE